MKLKVGDVVKIKYHDTIPSKSYNKILITDIVDNKIVAVWYEGDVYDGMLYSISKHQKIFEIVKRNVDVEKFLKEKGHFYEKNN